MHFVDSSRDVADEDECMDVDGSFNVDELEEIVSNEFFSVSLIGILCKLFGGRVSSSSFNSFLIFTGCSTC